MSAKVVVNRPRYTRAEMPKSEYLKLLENQEGVGSTKDARVVCPHCHTSQSPRDLVEAGVDKGEVMDYWGFSCIGSFDDKQGCNWTLGGLFQIHELDVIDGSGKSFPRFAPENWKGVPVIK